MLEVHGLAKRYGEVLALHSLSVRVEQGQCLVLLGRNGAGKTTALRCIAGVIVPTSGTVRVDGIDSASDPAAVRAKVGLMPEVPGLYERMSARTYLDYFGSIYDLESALRHRRIEELLEKFELVDAADRWLGSYSKGMRQKIALIRATLHRPRLVLADEPTSALDPHRLRARHLHAQHGRGRDVVWADRDHVRRSCPGRGRPRRAARAFRSEIAPRASRAADPAGHLSRDRGEPS